MIYIKFSNNYIINNYFIKQIINSNKYFKEDRSKIIKYKLIKNILLIIKIIYINIMSAINRFK